MEERVTVCCNTCEFNFDEVCVGHGTLINDDDTYGMSIKDTASLFPFGCDDWNISLEAFTELRKINLS